MSLIDTVSAPLDSPARVDFRDTTGWFAAYTCAHHEKFVAGQLRERCIPHFLPLYRSVRRWKDRLKELDMVLFPGYVFVNISPQCRLQILQVPGVVRLVTFNGQPARLPCEEIEALRSGLADGMRAEIHPYLRVGRKVRVVRGPLAGIEGILLRKKDKLRFVISIDVLMRSVAVELSAADVASAL